MVLPRLPLGKRLTAALLCLGVLGAVGCDDDSGEPDVPEPSVEIVAPTGEDELGGTVEVVVELEGFELNRDPLGGPDVEGEGRLRFTMDRGQFDFPEHSGANGELARKLGVDGQYSPATEPRITYTGLPPGDHRLTVALVNNDYSATGASDSIAFTVE